MRVSVTRLFISLSIFALLLPIAVMAVETAPREFVPVQAGFQAQGELTLNAGVDPRLFGDIVINNLIYHQYCFLCIANSNNLIIGFYYMVP